MFLQHNWTHLIREKQRRKCHLIRRDMMYIQPYVFKGILSVLIKTLPNLWTYRAACQPYGKSLSSILRIWINNKHYLVNLNEENTSMLNLIEVETYKKKIPWVLFFFQCSSLKGCVHTLTLCAHLLDRRWLKSISWLLLKCQLLYFSLIF